MASLCKVLLIGNLGKDPETRYMSNGDAVTNITLATTDTWKDKNGEKQEKTEWVNVVFYKKLAEIVTEYLRKGSQVYVEGRLETRKWTDKNGIERYTTQVIANEMKMLGGKKDSAESNDSGSSKSSAGGFDDMVDDIPF